MDNSWLHSSRDAFAGLESSCPGVSDTHVHASWYKTAAGAFATELETVYPELLCLRVKEIVLELLCFQPLTSLPVTCGRGETVSQRLRQERLAAGKQLRGSRARQLPSEFEKVVTIRGKYCASQACTRPGHSWCVVPAGAKTARCHSGGDTGHRSNEEMFGS